MFTAAEVGKKEGKRVSVDVEFTLKVHQKDAAVTITPSKNFGCLNRRSFKFFLTTCLMGSGSLL